MESEVMKELRSLKGERAAGEKMIGGQQFMMAERLHGEMGRDMLDVLEGRKKVRLPMSAVLKAKLRWLRNLFFGKKVKKNDYEFYYGGI